MLKVIVTPEARDLFPELGVGGLLARNADRCDTVKAANAATLLAERRMASFCDYEAVTNAPEVNRWREAFKAMGLRPAEYRTSLEALMRMWVTGRRPDGGGLVDLYNIVSIASGAPLGAVDVERLDGQAITLRKVEVGVDKFVPVSGVVKLKPEANAISYCVRDNILCYGLNHRDSADFGINPTSSNIFFLSEWAFLDQREKAWEALHLLGRLLTDHGGVTVDFVQFDT